MLSKVFYDMHIHSCLSPCGDDEMTPCNIAGMASIKGLGIVALTDHNSCGNCPAFFSACSEFSIVPIAGAEVTTSEDIHVVTLFESLEGAMDFDRLLSTKRTYIENEPNIFGNQLYMDDTDTVIGTEPCLLINAVDISVDDINRIAAEYGGVAYPAHVDKMSNSITSVFGMIPDIGFNAFEFADISRKDEFSLSHPIVADKLCVTSSDAHYLWDINEGENFLEVYSDLSDADSVRSEIISLLRGKTR